MACNVAPDLTHAHAHVCLHALPPLTCYRVGVGMYEGAVYDLCRRGGR